MRTVSELEKVSFRTHVRNLNALYLLKTRFLASLRNDIITNYNTATKAGLQEKINTPRFLFSPIGRCFLVLLIYCNRKPRVFKEM